MSIYGCLRMLDGLVSPHWESGERMGACSVIIWTGIWLSDPFGHRIYRGYTVLHSSRVCIFNIKRSCLLSNFMVLHKYWVTLQLVKLNFSHDTFGVPPPSRNTKHNTWYPSGHGILWGKVSRLMTIWPSWSELSNNILTSKVKQAGPEKTGRIKPSKIFRC